MQVVSPRSELVVTPLELAAALAEDRLCVHYQPVVTLAGRQVVGFEALARLRADDGTLLLPSAFVAQAERYGLIRELGEAVLRTALRRAARWRAGSSLAATATISVNVAPAQLEHEGFFDLVRGLLAENDLPGSAVILEITESTATSSAARPTLERISALGIRIALDDFGVGFATLDNVRRLPVQVLKLDRSFVTGVGAAGADRAIVRAVVDLADALGLSVIAEGVETEAQSLALLRLGCPAGQGNLFAPPGEDPDAAAARVGRHAGSHSRAAGDDVWAVEVDTAVLAAARLLAAQDGEGGATHRSTVHAVATALARETGLSASGVHAVGRLALVHDIGRLAVDSGLPAGLAREPLLAALAVGGRPRPEPAEVRLVRLAAGVANAAEKVPLSAALLGVRVGTQRRWPSTRGDQHVSPSLMPQTLRMALARLADAPPEVQPLGELVDDLDRRRMGRRGMEDRLRSLVGVTRVLASSRDTRELLSVALEEVRRIVGAASASLERWERESGQLRTLINVGQLGPGEVAFPADETYALAAYSQTRRTLLDGLPYMHTVDDAHAAPEATQVLRHLQKYSSAAVPVYLEGRMWGQIWMTTDYGEPPFGAADIELLTAVATLMGGVVVQAENLDRVARMAFEDPLTRVGNRRAVDDVLERLSADGRPTALMLLDVDLLKQINDRQGHARGDEALIRLADALSSEMSSVAGAMVGRLGGDEFCVVLPGCDRTAARAHADRMQAMLADGPDPVAVSVGVAESTPGWTPRDLLASADAQLYGAKRRARALRRRPGSRSA